MIIEGLAILAVITVVLTVTTRMTGVSKPRKGIDVIYPDKEIID